MSAVFDDPVALARVRQELDNATAAANCHRCGCYQDGASSAGR